MIAILRMVAVGDAVCPAAWQSWQMAMLAAPAPEPRGHNIGGEASGVQAPRDRAGATCPLNLV